MAHRRAHIVVGLGFGDEGKGTTVDFLTRKTKAKLIVRYNGGAQAGHNVVTPDGIHHTFAQFGSGMLANPQVQTFLSRFMVIHPEGLIKEATVLDDLHIGTSISSIKRVIIDERALIITPYHQVTNRLRELARGEFRHGSCGVGVGETVSDKDTDYAIRAEDLYNANGLMIKLARIRDSRIELAEQVNRMGIPGTDRMLKVFQDYSYITRTAEYLLSFAKLVRIYPWYRVGEVFKDVEDVIFEGAQGILLDEKWGFYPFTTWSNCTVGNALELLKHDAGGDRTITTYGVTRCYGTRHGAGPFPTEDNLTTVIKNRIEHNRTHDWQGQFRVGWFDGVLARYALRANEVEINNLVVTNLDRMDKLDNIKICGSYSSGLKLEDIPRVNNSFKDMEAFTMRLMKEKPNYYEVEFRDLLASIAREFGRSGVSIASFGPTWKDKTQMDVNYG